MLNLGRVESIKLLSEYHDKYTCDCCPTMPDPIDPIPQLQGLTGSFPVIVNAYDDWRIDASNRAYSMLPYPEDEKAHRAIRAIKEDEFYKNVMSPETFAYIRELLQTTRIKLIKQSSPKISNLILSIGKFIKDEYSQFEERIKAWDEVEKSYNDRGTNQLKGYELLISTEPHRIAGMSAFGHFTSCQDWIEKDKDHGYHDYTHMSWANLNDPTIGVCCIRKVGDVEAKDMLARSLIRVMPLNNGHVMVYLGKLYAHAPYDRYINSSLKEWAKGLPSNYHAVFMFDGGSPRNVEGKAVNGTTINGCEWVSYDLDHELIVYGTRRCQCDTCDGSGMVPDHQSCDCCDGTGRVEFEDDCGNVYRCTCKQCDGEGEFEGDETECPDCDGFGYCDIEEESYEPYNDHSNWVQYSSDRIEYNVPRYILSFNNTDNTDEEITNNEAIAI